ncbi:MAG TPA: ComEA family DNA-binding protein [Luteimonas sp.]|nr:ComEA family DNA-binding protein [Luteimonas sp.]HRO26918.1 ComEA family DNA-binding protein [Luteimonas sp.]HRP72849.1 ComEA family DNA-binding protein [Luteimonas sp.]
MNIRNLFASALLSLALLGTAFAAEKVNINTADAATLDRVLHNVGPSKAEAIVAWRKDNGPFRSPEQLAQVKGIGLRTVEQNRERIVVSAPTPARAPGAATGATRATAQTR